MIKSIWVSSWHRSLDAELIDVAKQANRLDVQIGWIRFPTDGTRVQVFDRRGDRICKISKKGVVTSTVRTEIEVRSYISDLAPAILKASSDGLAFVEEWVPSRGVPYSLDILVEVLGKLRKRLYVIEYVDREQYRDMLAIYGKLTDRAECILNLAFSAFPQRLLPISQVHGDLVYQNMRYHPERGLLLLDWEYSRKCLVTYDCWLYLYGYYRFADDKSPLPDKFPSLLSQLFKQMGFNFSTQGATALHLLHLLERQSFLSYVLPTHTLSVPQIMETDIEMALASLT